MSLFVDSSVWFAAAVAKDRDNARAIAILSGIEDFVTSDHVIVETWLLLNSRYSRYRRSAAEQFWKEIRRGGVHIETPKAADMDAATIIGELFPDQEFSIVDRTSFAMMERLGITKAASFDAHFAIYRYGRERNKAFEIVR